MVLRWMWATVAAALVVLMAGCGRGDSGGGGGGGGKMKVGLMVVGSTSDGGWDQMAKESLDKLAGPEGVNVRVQQSVSADKAADAIRQFDAQGFSLVIAHGYEYLQAAKELTNPAKEGAVKVKVAVSGGDVDDPHFASLDYDLSGASYQLGVIAAKVSKSGKLGFIGGEKFPTVVAMQRGFMAGAKSVNPNVTFAEAWPGWADPSKAKREAEAFIAQGVDVIMQDVDAASRGVFEAVEENAKPPGAQRYTVYTFGANSDQNANPVCADYTLASAVIRMDVAFGRVIKEVKAGTFKGGLVKEDLASGVSVAVLNPRLVGKVIDDATVKLVEEAGKKIISGEVTVPKD